MQIMRLVMSYTQPNIQFETLQQRSLKPGRLILLQTIIVSLSTCICRYSLGYTKTTNMTEFGQYLFFVAVFSLPCFYLINNANAHLIFGDCDCNNYCYGPTYCTYKQCRIVC